MESILDRQVVWALAQRTFRQSMESPVFYVVAIFFYGFVGGLFGMNYFINNQATLNSITQIAPWALWFVIPALTMGLLSDELRSGTFEGLATLPVRDWEIVLGKYLGFALTVFILIGGMLLYALVVSITGLPGQGRDLGGSIGSLAGLAFMCLAYGAMGIFASSLAKNQVVSLIGGMMICTIFFLLGMFTQALPPFIGRIADLMGVLTHMESVARGVWDIRDLFYFASVIMVFLYLTVQRLTTRRF